MSSDARRKEKKRLKREKKKADHRRQMSVSPYKRIGQTGEIDACYINSNWKEEGLAAIQVVRRNPAGGFAVATFLVDVWCAGLKDVTGRLDLLHEDVQFNLERARKNYPLQRIDLETAQKLVAAGIRFAQQNGFRLPPHLDRWINLLGGVGDIADADLSSFRKDGKLCWVGSLNDLQTRLIGSTPDQFLSRPDVEFISEVSEPEFFEEDAEEDEIDEDSEEFEALVADMAICFHRAAGKLAEKLRQEFTDRAQLAPALLNDALRFMLAGQTVRESKDDPKRFNDDLGCAQLAAAADIMEEFVSSKNKTPSISSELMNALEIVTPLLGELGGELSVTIDQFDDAVEGPIPQSGHQG